MITYKYQINWEYTYLHVQWFSVHYQNTVDFNGFQWSRNGVKWSPMYPSITAIGNWGMSVTNSYDKYKFGNQAW